MSKPLLPARFLFHFAAPCKRLDKDWTVNGGELDETYRLPSLVEIEGRGVWADLRAAWSDEGVALTVIVRGKSKPPCCDRSNPEGSDGLHVWIDTRDVHNVHRAGRFCHRFAFLPENIEGETKKTAARRSAKKFAAVCSSLPINRAKDRPRPVAADSLRAYCTINSDGYGLNVLIPASALTGFDPAEHPRLGFTYAVIDRELGEQTFAVGGPMPYQEDPSLWATLELVP
ncbi:MAG: hypothetical protein JW959_06150 [Pirellulales bacterium]|nr:hypothetical protein [Pirellulales bacterium]